MDYFSVLDLYTYVYVNAGEIYNERIYHISINQSIFMLKLKPVLAWVSPFREGVNKKKRTCPRSSDPHPRTAVYSGQRYYYYFFLLLFFDMHFNRFRIV